MQTYLDPRSEQFLADLGRIQDRVAQANRQVSSGLKIQQASDAPDQVAPLLQLRADQQHNQQIQANLSQAASEAQAADTALSSSIQLMDRAVVLGTEGTSPAMDAGSRQGLAQEVQSLLEQMVANSTTAVQGHYIFSGDQDGTPQYEVNPAGANGVTQVTAAGATRQVESPAGGSFAASQTAQQIFDARNADGTPADGNVFASLSGLRAALLGGDPQAIAQSVHAVQDASAHLNLMQSSYGTVENRIQEASNFASQYNVQLQTELSQKADADVAAAALQLSQGNLQLQAAFQMEAGIPKKSLFEYLG